MRAHVVEDGVVINTIEISALSDFPNTVEATVGDIGWHYDGTTFIDPNSPTQEEANETKASNNRKKRNILLAQTDWTQSPDSPLSNEDKTAWATYRQLLRDISSLDAWPYIDDDWPVAPQG